MHLIGQFCIDCWLVFLTIAVFLIWGVTGVIQGYNKTTPLSDHGDSRFTIGENGSFDFILDEVQLLLRVKGTWNNLYITILTIHSAGASFCYANLVYHKLHFVFTELLLFVEDTARLLDIIPEDILRLFNHSKLACKHRCLNQFFIPRESSCQCLCSCQSRPSVIFCGSFSVIQQKYS